MVSSWLSKGKYFSNKGGNKSISGTWHPCNNKSMDLIKNRYKSHNQWHRPSVHLPVRPSARPSARAPIRPSIHLPLSVRPCANPSVRPSNPCPSVCPSVRPFIRRCARANPSVCLSVRPSVRPFVRTPESDLAEGSRLEG